MYGWENYLSERDKKHDEIRGKKELYGFGNKPALLLIDMYYSVVGLKREPIFESMKTWSSSTGLEGWAAVDKTAELLEVARANGIPVIHVKGLQSGINSWGRNKRKRVELTEELRMKGTQIVDEVKPIPGELIIEKASPSAFPGTSLIFYLNSLGIDTLICCGETTSGCVRATVVDGCTNRYHMGVVAECVYDRTEASHYMNLYDMHQKYADVVGMTDAANYFQEIGALRKEAIQA